MGENKPTLREQALQITTESLRATEMRQGCTNHSWYAGLLLKQLVNLLKEELDGLTLTYEEIDAKLENEWDGLDQISLAQFVQEYTIKELKEKMGG